MFGNVWHEILNMAVQYRAHLMVGVGFVLAFFALWLLFRGLRLWYWKVGERIDAMQSIESEIAGLKAELDSKLTEEKEAGDMRSARIEDAIREGARIQAEQAAQVCNRSQQPAQGVQTVQMPQAPLMQTIGIPVMGMPQVAVPVQMPMQQPVMPQVPVQMQQVPVYEERQAAPQTEAQMHVQTQDTAAAEPAAGAAPVEPKDTMKDWQPEFKVEENRREGNYAGHRYEDRDCACDKFGRVYTRDEIEANIKA